MKKIALSIGLCVASFGLVNAQTTSKDSSLQISGSADVYYMYNLAASKDYSPSQDALNNNFNIIDFGMLDLKLNKEFGKASFFSELAFGARANSSIDVNSTNPLSYYIQNLYFSYQIQKQLSVTAGIMYRYDTYEKLTSVDNFNYLDSNAFIESRKVPTRSVGIKANYTFNDMVSASIGLFNSIDTYKPISSDAVAANPNSGLSDVVAQLFVDPMKDLKLSAAIWKEGQKNKGTHINFQAHYKLNKGLNLGLDLNKYAGLDSATEILYSSNFTSVGLYAQQKITNIFSLGARLEHEQTEQNTVSNSFVNENYNIITLTGKEKFGPLSLKQEIKYDMTDNSNVNTPYSDKNARPTNKNVEFVLSAIYAF